jgi:Asp-tRNA(Asn)/Glu-tRNA(Gln) amidotransferase C subunit
VFDGRKVSYSNLAEEEKERTLSVFNVTLHVLSQADSLDLETREPRTRPAHVLDGDGVGAAGRR